MIYVVTVVIVAQKLKCYHRDFHCFQHLHIRSALVRQSFQWAVQLRIEYELIRFILAAYCGILSVYNGSKSIIHLMDKSFMIICSSIFNISACNFHSYLARYLLFNFCIILSGHILMMLYKNVIKRYWARFLDKNCKLKYKILEERLFWIFRD